MKLKTRTRTSLGLLTAILVLLSPSRLLAQDGFWDYIHELSGPMVILGVAEFSLYPHWGLFGLETLTEEGQKGDPIFRISDDKKYTTYITFAIGSTVADQSASPSNEAAEFTAALYEPAVRLERYSPHGWTRALFRPEIFRVGYAIYHFKSVGDAFENFSNDAVTFTLLWNFAPDIKDFDFLAGVRVRRFSRAFTPEDFGGTGETRPTGETVPSILLQVRWRPR